MWSWRSRETCSTCRRVTGSAASVLWAEAAAELGGFFSAVSLAELAQRQRDIDGAAATMYWI